MDDSQKLDILWKQMQAYRDLLGDPSEVEAVLDELGHEDVAEWMEEADADAAEEVEADGGEGLLARLERVEEAAGLRGNGEVPSTDWDRDRQVRHVRAMAYGRAASRDNGRASVTYDDVETLFRSDISPGQCYKLLRAAAGYDAARDVSEKEGFTFDADGGSQQRLLVNAAAVNDSASFHAVNNGGRREGEK